jgi:hypothetical protein
MVANAIGAQVANAIGAIATVDAMTEAQTQAHRRQRLADLLAHEEFSGNKAELGRALGYTSGAFVRQMIDGERPVTEKTVALVHSIRGGKFKDWFALSSPTAPPSPDIPAHVLRLLEDLEDLTPAKRSAFMDMIHQAAEEARAAAEHLERRRRPTMAASAGRTTATLTLRHGDGNPAQHSLPLTTVQDPFTAQPSERESALYERIAESKENTKT